MNKKTIILNWKMEPDNEANASKKLALINDLFSLRNDMQVFLAPPHVYLDSCRRFLEKEKSSVLLCAQDCSFDDSSAFTGETSAEMLQNLSVKAVLIGHSERRIKLGETVKEISGKVLSVLAHSMTPVLCIGESYEIWKSGESAVKKLLIKELEDGLLRASDTIKGAHVIVAYEPIWAISANASHPNDPVYVEHIGAFIKKEVEKRFSFSRVRILYGGSVNRESLRSYLNSRFYEGCIIGAASHDSNFLRYLAVS